MNTQPPIRPQFQICNGVKIRFALWAPPKATRGRVLLLQGRAEFLEKYLETVNDLLARGFEVMSLDWRGQGGSARILEDPFKGHILEFNQYLMDVQALCSNWLSSSGAPCYLLAHSMGAHIGLRLLANHPSWFKAAFFCSPMWDLITEPYTRWQARWLAKIACLARMAESYGPDQDAYRFSALEFNGNVLSSDPMRFERNQKILRSQPELEIGGVTFGWLNASFESIQRTHSRGYAEKVQTPMTVCVAEQDQVVDNWATRQLTARLANAKLRQLAGGRHELLQEQAPIREKLWLLFDSLIEAH
jgi:lysophospholipase